MADLLTSTPSKEVAKLVATLEGDEKTGAAVIMKALEAPLFHIAANARDWKALLSSTK